MLLALLGGGIIMFLLSGLWYMVLMKDFYAQYASEHLMLPEVNLMAIGLGYLILAWLMSYVYPIGYKGGTPWWEGMKFGIIIGLLWVLPNGLVISGVWEYNSTQLIVDSIWHVVEQGVGGLIIGMIYGKYQTTATTSETATPTTA